MWAFVESLDLTAFHARIKAVEGHSGRPPIDPAILVSLWLYATLEGVGSARALDRLCDEHDAYRWLAGGVGVNYHTLAAFRVEQADLLDRLLTESVAALLADGLVTLATVAQDGMRVRASAGAASYRPTLEHFLAEAEAQVIMMSDGGYRPAYNVQFAADTESQVIVALDVTPAGTDHGQLRPMVGQLRSR